MVEVAGGERPGEDDDGVDGVGDDDHGNVVDVDVERNKSWKWPEESERVKMMMKVMMMSIMMIIEMSIMFLMLMLNVRNFASGCRRATRLCSNGN